MTPAVLFVCLGNICRSPLADGALRAAARRRGVAVVTDSAGTGDWHVGDPPDPRAQAVALKHGVDIRDLRARQVKTKDFYRFTHVIALDYENLRTLETWRPQGAPARVALLMDFVRGREGEAVADPFFGDGAGFDRTWADVAQAAEALLDTIVVDR